MDDILSTSEAAQRIGVSERQVRNLINSHLLASVADNAVTESSVARYKLNRNGASRRAWSESTAWQAVAILAHSDVTTIGQSQKSRLTAALRTMSAEQFVLAVRNRAHTYRCVGHRHSAARISRELVNVNTGTAILSLTATAENVDGYATATTIEQIIARYHLRVNFGASDAALLRAVTAVDIDVVRKVNEDSEVLAALSLSESLDTRERSAGLDFLKRALKEGTDAN